jgi:predicted transcriptional regulator
MSRGLSGECTLKGTFVNSVIEFAAHIVGTYVSKNPVSPGDRPKLIAEVHAALSGLGKPGEPQPEQRVPAVAVKRSAQPEALICLECGKKLKSLKRHLSANHNLTPEEYRPQWNLPHSYPMVAPAYSETPSSLAKAAGLVRKPAAKTARKSRQR